MDRDDRREQEDCRRWRDAVVDHHRYERRGRDRVIDERHRDGRERKDLAREVHLGDEIRVGRERRHRKSERRRREIPDEQSAEREQRVGQAGLDRGLLLFRIDLEIAIQAKVTQDGQPQFSIPLGK